MLTCLQLREQKIPKLITIPFQASVLRWPSFHARFSTCMGFTFLCNFLLTFYLQTVFPRPGLSLKVERPEQQALFVTDHECTGDVLFQSAIQGICFFVY